MSFSYILLLVNENSLRQSELRKAVDREKEILDNSWILI